MKIATLSTLSILALLAAPRANSPSLTKVTPILIVDEIEPALPLWTEHLGFEKTAEVPETEVGGKLGFVILSKGDLEIMYQTRGSVMNEEALPESMKRALGPTAIFIEVRDLTPIRDSVQDFDVLVPHRETFYGTQELWLREPGGHLIGFSAPLN